MRGDSVPPSSIAVLGAGIIGLACALELGDRGARVSLFEPTWPPRGASWAAAGMLAPAFEAAAGAPTHSRLFELCYESAELWPEWAAGIEARSGLPSGYHPGPSLAVATTTDQAAHFRLAIQSLQDHPARPQPCFDDVRKLEPALTATLEDAILLPKDGQVDNRLILTALVACIENHPNVTVHDQPAALTAGDGTIRVDGHEKTLVTAGWRSSAIKVGERTLADWAPSLSEVTPFGGQMLSVAPVAGGPSRPVRCGHVYIVPKSDRIIIGATTEPDRVLSVSEPEQIETLRTAAIALCPALAAAPILETWVGVRPGTPDHAPILGESRTPGLFIATGHFRNGILLAPVTAKLMADLLLEHTQGDLAAAFAPNVRRSVKV